MKTFGSVCVVAFLGLLVPSQANAQESKSESLARELVTALSTAKLESIAAPDPSQPGTYVGALHIPGVQLMMVSAKYPAPDSIEFKLANKAYRDIYLDLSAAGLAERVVVEDTRGDGIRVRRRTDSEPFDSIEVGGKQLALDYDFKRQKISLADYLKAFATAEDRYVAMLKALLEQLKKS